jgi:peptidoglycan/LPS O-acetylase OafA/YrhL
MLGITFSPNARKILAHPIFNFLGRCSYAIYLLHHTLIRAILLPMLYGYAYLTTPERDDKGKIILLKAPPKIVFFLVMPLFHIILFYIAHLWTEYVDTYCGKLVDRVKDGISRNDDTPGEKNGILPMNSVAIGVK